MNIPFSTLAEFDAYHWLNRVHSLSCFQSVIIQIDATLIWAKRSQETLTINGTYN